MRTAPKRRREDGFTLIEVIVALVIAVAGLVAMFQAISGGMMSVEDATRHTTAIRYAQAHLEESGITRPLQAGVQRGTDEDGFSWSIRITPLGSRSRGDKAGASGSITLFAVEVQVAWRVDQREKSVRLESYRLGPPTSVSGGEATR